MVVSAPPPPASERSAAATGRSWPRLAWHSACPSPRTSPELLSMLHPRGRPLQTRGQGGRSAWKRSIPGLSPRGRDRRCTVSSRRTWRAPASCQEVPERASARPAALTPRVPLREVLPQPRLLFLLAPHVPSCTHAWSPAWLLGSETDTSPARWAVDAWGQLFLRRMEGGLERWRDRLHEQSRRGVGVGGEERYPAWGPPPPGVGGTGEIGTNPVWREARGGGSTPGVALRGPGERGTSAIPEDLRAVVLVMTAKATCKVMRKGKPRAWTPGSHVWHLERLPKTPLLTPDLGNGTVQGQGLRDN